MDMWWGWGRGWGVFFGLLNAAFWIALIVLVVHLVRGREPRRPPPGPHSPPGPSTSSALRILEERYARGEIAREEFMERRAVLSGEVTPPGSGSTPMPPPATGGGGRGPMAPPPPPPEA